MLIKLFSISFTSLKGFTNIGYAETFLPAMLWERRLCPNQNISVFSDFTFVMRVKSVQINQQEALLSFPYPHWGWGSAGCQQPRSLIPSDISGFSLLTKPSTYTRNGGT